MKVGENSFRNTTRLNLNSLCWAFRLRIDLPSLVEFSCESLAFSHTELGNVTGGRWGIPRF